MSRPRIFDLYGAVVGEIMEWGQLLPEELAQVPLPEWFLEMMVLRRAVYPDQVKRYIVEFAAHGLVKFRSAVPRMPDYPSWLPKVFDQPVDVVYLIPTSNVPPVTILNRVEEFTKAAFRRGRLDKEEGGVIVGWNDAKRLNVMLLTTTQLSRALFNHIRDPLPNEVAYNFYHYALRSLQWFFRFLQERGVLRMEDEGIRLLVSLGEAVEKVDEYLVSLTGGESHE
ncbi:hypothetical protein APY94_04110 [Thermococcus celericrescens]|uniref:Uncharacterized protein n=2 Tax=Thermococcus celericrescens TaxID=227598 RepID=A0A124EBG2_9EURY|nr:hypothetical protein APY94_04110 [Thermococcus celericrescens]